MRVILRRFGQCCDLASIRICDKLPARGYSNRNILGRHLIRYLPTFVIALILLLVAVLVDRQQGEVLLHDSWEQVGISLETTRSRFERRLDTSIEILHELAGKLGASEDIPQSEFELLAESAFGERPEALVT